MRPADEFLGLHRHTTHRFDADCPPPVAIARRKPRAFGIGLLRKHQLERDIFIAFAGRRDAVRRVLSAEECGWVPDHFGIVAATAPPGVGTVTFAPSTASFREIGKSR